MESCFPSSSQCQPYFPATPGTVFSLCQYKVWRVGKEANIPKNMRYFNNFHIDWLVNSDSLPSLLHPQSWEIKALVTQNSDNMNFTSMSTTQNFIYMRRKSDSKKKMVTNESRHIVNLKAFKSMKQYSEQMSTGLDLEGTGTSLCYSGVGAVLKMYQLAFNCSSPVVLGILTSCRFL